MNCLCHSQIILFPARLNDGDELDCLPGCELDSNLDLFYYHIKK